MCQDRIVKKEQMCAELCPYHAEINNEKKESCSYCKEELVDLRTECVQSCDQFKYWLSKVCGAGAGVLGSFGPSALYSWIGMTGAGPAAGGMVAGAQAAGNVAAGGLWATLQGAAMTGPLAPVVLASAALGGSGYYLCDKYAD